MSENTSGPSRREFMGTVGAIGAAGAVGAVVAGCSSGIGERYTDYQYPPLLDTAPDGPVLKAGLIGCGGRGTGAAEQWLSAGPNLEITALGDIFQDRMDRFRRNLKRSKDLDVPDENCFIGLDAYQKVIDSGVDVILLATQPFFRPEHFAAAIDARKHVFMEKPVAVDPVGARSIMSTARKADGAGLCVVTGTQRRHQRDYVEVFRKITEGAIGEIVSANCYWNGGVPWFEPKRAGWSDMEAMLRDWVNWIWLSGDHIVEQHVHNIDVINWYTGMHPVKALGFGSRLRRPTGDQFDNFSIDFVYENGIHVHSMCRQISGCTNNVSEFVIGTKGRSNCSNTIYDLKGEEIWRYPGYLLDEEGNPTNRLAVGPYFQEHIDLVTAIRTGEQINEAENTAISTLTAIMGRTSAYTGKEVTWEEMMNSDLKIGPESVEMGPSDYRAVIPVPGIPDPRLTRG